MFFTSNVWCCLRLLHLSSFKKLQGKQCKQNTSPKSYKFEVKILANLYNELYMEISISSVNYGEKYCTVMESLQSVEENPSSEHCKSHILTWIKHITIKEISSPSFLLSPLHLFFCLKSHLF